MEDWPPKLPRTTTFHPLNTDAASSRKQVELRTIDEDVHGCPIAGPPVMESDMKLEEAQIAKMNGGVFFDQFVDQDWPGLYERVRLRVRQSLQDFQTTPSFEPQIANRRILVKYDCNGTPRQITLTDESLVFEVGHFSISAGVPRDIGILLEALLRTINRQEWNEIGCAFAFAFPAKRDKTQEKSALDFLLKTLDLDYFADLVPPNCREIAQIKLRGTSEHQRLELELRNTSDQDIIAILDTRIPFMHFQHSGIQAHLEDLLLQFTTRFDSLFRGVMQAPGLAGSIDMPLLREGKPGN